MSNKNNLNVLSDFYVEGKSVPQNLEAEEAVLGGILVDANSISRIKEELKPEDFHLSSHKTIYTAALEVHRSGTPVDLMTVATYLADHKQLDMVGGQSRLIELYDQTPGAVNIDLYAGLVRKKAIARSMIEIGRSITMEGFRSDLTTEEMLSRTSEIYRQTQDFRSKESTGLVALHETLSSNFSEIEYLANTGVVPGTLSGFYDIDSITNGFQDGDLIIVAGRPSMGKTAHAISIALNVAGFGKTVAVFSMEMSSEQLAHRLLSIESSIEVSRLKAGHIRANEWEVLGHTIAKLSNLPFYIDNQAMLSPESLVSSLDYLEAKNGEKVDFVVIDYLQLMDSGQKSLQGNKNLEVSLITRLLKRIAIQRDIPIVLLSQLSRGVESRADKRPMMSDLRDSGSIEQDADLIMMLYRDEYYDKNTVDLGIAEVIAVKNRNGPTGTAKLLFEPQFTRFRNLRSD